MGDGSEVYRAVLGPIWEQWHQYDITTVSLGGGDVVEAPTSKAVAVLEQHVWGLKGGLARPDTGLAVIYNWF